MKMAKECPASPSATLAAPVLGAVHLNHTDWFGVPGSFVSIVAPSVKPPTMGLDPASVAALANASFAGGGGRTSSSVMVTATCVVAAGESTAPCAFESSTMKSSSPSTCESLAIGMVIVRVISEGLNVTVPALVV